MKVLRAVFACALKKRTGKRAERRFPARLKPLQGILIFVQNQYRLEGNSRTQALPKRRTDAAKSARPCEFRYLAATAGNPAGRRPKQLLTAVSPSSCYKRNRPRYFSTHTPGDFSFFDSTFEWNPGVLQSILQSGIPSPKQMAAWLSAI